MPRKLVLALDEDAEAALQDLQAHTGAASFAEVLRDSLGVYKSLKDLWVENRGRRLVFIDEETETMQELVIHTLQRDQA